jgi:hypothetical protein
MREFTSGNLHYLLCGRDRGKRIRLVPFFFFFACLPSCLVLLSGLSWPALLRPACLPALLCGNHPSNHSVPFRSARLMKTVRPLYMIMLIPLARLPSRVSLYFIFAVLLGHARPPRLQRPLRLLTTSTWEATPTPTPAPAPRGRHLV